ncbi:hypothetical protein Lser_V15G43948 [Lactuca serriola]
MVNGSDTFTSSAEQVTVHDRREQNINNSCSADNASDTSTSSAQQVTMHDGHEQNTNNSCSVDNDSKARVEVNDSNASTSCADKEAVQDGSEQIKINFESAKSVSKACDDDTPTIEKSQPQKFVKQPNKCSCACACACGSSSKRTFFGQGPSHNLIYMKRQTCFNCRTPGHISRNCPHCLYVPYYKQGWQNVPRGKFSKKNPSRSHSRNGDWNMKKTNNQSPKVQKGMSDKMPNSRDFSVRQRSVRSKSSRRLVSSSKASAEPSIRSNKKWVKLDYRWVPKVLTPKSSNDSNISSSSVSDKQDMSWERVHCVDDNGQPSFKLDWVPNSN